jgi:hypothetical protein
MIAGSNCDCLVCRLEKTLIAGLGEEWTSEEWRLPAPQGGILPRFSNPLDLVRELHTPEDRKDSSSSDALLSELLKRNSSTPPPSVWQRLLLLVFIPTIHRTASQITAMFPTLARDDTSQHVVTVFLEFLDSTELQTRNSHVAFTIHESRGVAPEEAEGDRIVYVEEAVAAEPRYAEVLLQQFLDNCEKMGWLTVEERNLLVRFKIEGVTCEELAGRNGHSAVAMQHRIGRLLDRLRRLAHRTRWERSPEQLELFPR